MPKEGKMYGKWSSRLRIKVIANPPPRCPRVPYMHSNHPTVDSSPDWRSCKQARHPQHSSRHPPPRLRAGADSCPPVAALRCPHRPKPQPSPGFPFPFMTYIHTSPTMLEPFNSSSVLANESPPKRCCSCSEGSTFVYDSGYGIGIDERIAADAWR